MCPLKNHGKKSFLALGIMLVGASATSVAHQFIFDPTEAALTWSHGQVRVAAFAGDTKSARETTAQAPVKCREAEVNPVTGHAECVRPRGAAVDPPPQSAVPCSARHVAGDKHGCPPSPPANDSRQVH